MAFKISKQDDKRLADLRDRITAAREKLDDVISEQNAIIDNAYFEMNSAIGEYNELLTEARGVVEDLASEAENEYDDKSDNWRDGDRGQATYEWLEALKSFEDDAGDIDTQRWDEIDLSGVDDHAELIDNLPREPTVANLEIEA